MKSSAEQGGCYPQRPKTEVDNTLRHLQNSSYATKAEFNNCFIICSKYFPVLKGVSPFRSLFFYSPKLTQSLPQVFSVNGLNNLVPRAFTPSQGKGPGNEVAVQKSAAGCIFDVIDSIWRRFFPNLVNSSWLWWIMRPVLTNQKLGNILNE